MSLNVYFKDDIKATITAGIVLAIETTTANGTANVEHIRGILTLGKYQALVFGIDWPELITDARIALGPNYDELLAGERQVIEG